MTLHPGPRHAVIERHLLMAQRCNTLAAELYQHGEGEAAARQRQLLAVLLHNVLMQLPPTGDPAAAAAAWPVSGPARPGAALAGARPRIG